MPRIPPPGTTPHMDPGPEGWTRGTLQALLSQRQARYQPLGADAGNKKGDLAAKALYSMAARARAVIHDSESFCLAHGGLEGAKEIARTCGYLE